MTAVTYRDANPPYLFPAYFARHDGDGLPFDIQLQGAGETSFFGF